VNITQLREAFEKASKMRPGKVVANKIGHGMLVAIQVPWKITKIVVLSLEKVS
jgi:hypothetical protein